MGESGLLTMLPIASNYHRSRIEAIIEKNINKPIHIAKLSQVFRIASFTRASGKRAPEHIQRCYMTDDTFLTFIQYDGSLFTRFECCCFFIGRNKRAIHMRKYCNNECVRELDAEYKAIMKSERWTESEMTRKFQWSEERNNG